MYGITSVGARPSLPDVFLYFLLLALSFPFWAGPAGAAVHAPDMDQMLDRARLQGVVRVMVRFSAPGYQERLRQSRAFRLGARQGRLARPAARRADQALAGLLSDAADSALAGLNRGRYRELQRFATVPYVVLELTEHGLADLQALPGVEGVYPDLPERLEPPVPAAPSDGPDQPMLGATVGIIGATDAWDSGYTGAGWYVAVLDTGIRRTHEFFTGKDLVEACFARGMSGTGECPNGAASDYGPGSAAHHPSNYQGWDHGTHVAGIAAGSKPDQSLHGVAKDAGIIAVNVFSMIYDGSYWVGSYTSDQVLGLEYIYSLRLTYDIGAVNMSLGGGSYNSQSACDFAAGARKTAIDNLRAVGIATVIASGNSYYCDGVGMPGCISSAVAVGAVSDLDLQASFSNWQVDLMDLYAPGVSIYSSTGSTDTSYGSWSGTSMATPHAAGAFTLLRQRNPSASVDQILAAVVDTGPVLNTTCAGGGSKPRIQVDSAINALAAPAPACPGGAWMNLMLNIP